MVTRGIAPTLRAEPPKRQIAVETGDGFSPDWKATAAPTTTKALLEAAKCVRNNLFHGGKHGTPDGVRDPVLIAEALEVLGEILSKDEDLEWLFSEREGP